MNNKTIDTFLHNTCFPNKDFNKKIIPNDSEIIKFFYEELSSIENIEEFRLTKLEQINISKATTNYKNSIEWIIRINGLIDHLKYSIEKTIFFAKKMEYPLENTNNKNLYSYYLENSVYREIVLWDSFKQLLIAFYNPSEGNNKDSVFYYFKHNKHKGIDSEKILNHLKSKLHKKLRNDLRNSFAHSLDPTNSYVRHKEDSRGHLKPIFNDFIVDHPFENIYIVLKDLKKLIVFINSVSQEMFKKLKKELMYVELKLIVPCGKEIESDEKNYCFISKLKEVKEQIIFPCGKDCKKSFRYRNTNCCKPKKIYYKRVNVEEKLFSGEIILKKSVEEMKRDILLDES